MKKINILMIFVVIIIILMFGFIFLRQEPSPTETEMAFLEYIEPDTLQCLAKVRKNISLCEREVQENITDFEKKCKEDYYFFVSITNENIDLCNSIKDKGYQAFCKTILSKDKDNIMSIELCQKKPSMCEYIKNNNFYIDENFCEIGFNTTLGKQRCIAVIRKNESLCYNVSVEI